MSVAYSSTAIILEMLSTHKQWLNEKKWCVAVVYYSSFPELIFPNIGIKKTLTLKEINRELLYKDF